MDDTSSDIEELKAAFLKEGYKPFTFPKVQNVVKTSFPYTNPFSIAIGNYKVYPHLGHYIKVRTYFMWKVSLDIIILQNLICLNRVT